MNSETFVKNFFEEKQSLLNEYLKGQDTSVAHKIKLMDLSEKQREILEEMLDDVLTDSFYSILLGLSGSASIGNTQKSYSIYDEDGVQIEADEIEEYAYSLFQE
jgi:hypothetical protein